MLVHVDENVPASVAEVFCRRGHNVQHVRDVHARGTPDAAVAKAAIAAGAVVVTWDDDFKKLASRPYHSRLSVITFDCPEVDGQRRAEEEIEAIEFFYSQSVAKKERLRLEITKTTIKRVLETSEA